MANKILIKRSSVAGKEPLAADLDVGELAVNLADSKLYSKRSDGTVIPLSSGLNAENLISQVRNETGSPLLKGELVHITGGAGNKAVVSRAIASGESGSAGTFGMVNATIANNQNGYVTITGIVSGLDTQAYVEGTVLYLSPTVAGGYTSTKPYAPNHLVYVGTVIYSHQNQGSIQTRIQNGYELDEIHNVAISSPQDNQYLVYESSTSLWKNKTVAMTDPTDVAIAMAIALG